MNKRADVLSDAILKHMPAVEKKAEQEQAGFLAGVLKNMTKEAQEEPKAPPVAPVAPELDKQASEPVPASKDPSPTPNTSPEAQKAEPTSFLSKDTATLLAKQLGNEVYSAYAYYSIAGWFKNQGLDGFKKWADDQAKGEISHFQKIYDYLLEAGQEFAMPAIQGPIAKYSSVQSAVEAVLSLEKAVTNDWREIHRTAMKETDGATMQLGQDFLREQQEEEDKAYTLLQRVQLAGSKGEGILTIDSQLIG